MLVDIGCDTPQELFASSALRHFADIACSQLHGVTAIRAKQAVAVIALRRATVNDGYKVSAYDDSVLAFLLGVLGDDGLFYNLHADSCNRYGD